MLMLTFVSLLFFARHSAVHSSCLDRFEFKDLDYVNLYHLDTHVRHSPYQSIHLHQIVPYLDLYSRNRTSHNMARGAVDKVSMAPASCDWSHIMCYYCKSISNTSPVHLLHIGSEDNSSQSSPLIPRKYTKRVDTNGSSFLLVSEWSSEGF
jgi:hypothetical protein